MEEESIAVEKKKKRKKKREKSNVFITTMFLFLEGMVRGRCL